MVQVGLISYVGSVPRGGGGDGSDIEVTRQSETGEEVAFQGHYVCISSLATTPLFWLGLLFEGHFQPDTMLTWDVCRFADEPAVCFIGWESKAEELEHPRL